MKQTIKFFAGCPHNSHGTQTECVDNLTHVVRPKNQGIVFPVCAGHAQLYKDTATVNGWDVYPIVGNLKIKQTVTGFAEIEIP